MITSVDCSLPSQGERVNTGSAGVPPAFPFLAKSVGTAEMRAGRPRSQYLVARLGWEGPIYRSDHPFMIKEGRPPLKIANPHREDISIDLLIRILRQAGISRKDWLQARLGK